MGWVFENLDYWRQEVKKEIKPFKTGRDMLSIQGYEGNWDYDPYMHGLYNGMEFMLSLIEERDTVFKSAPEKWKRRSWLKKLLFKIKHGNGVINEKRN